MSLAVVRLVGGGAVGFGVVGFSNFRISVRNTRQIIIVSDTT